MFYRLCVDYLPSKNIKKGKIKPSSRRACITGGQRNAGEGCHKEGNSLQGPFCQSFVPSIKDGWRETTTDQPEGFDHIHTLQIFQERKVPSIKGNFGKRQLSMQVVPLRRLFLCSIEQTVKEICAFRMTAFPVRITLSVFWTHSSRKVVYKINESSNLHPIRQFSNIRKNFRGSNLKQGCCDIPVKKSRICHKLKEITFSPYTENRILRDDHRLGGDDSVPV